VNTPFSGSYASHDVQFLLKQLDVAPVDDVVLKEQLIQSGKKHYSEMIGREHLPSEDYFTLYEQAVEDNRTFVARDLLRLAKNLVERKGNDLTLVSLARAGTPFGVLLRRILASRFGIDAEHYSISIIRDRGIDANALDYIRARHNDESVAFIDGWSGKGAIFRELVRTMKDYNLLRDARIAPELFVAVDLAGIATAAGSGDDYLIPSAILNAPVSGLISRTILNEMIGQQDWHGCLFYTGWQESDRSRAYIDQIIEAIPSVSGGLNVMAETEKTVRFHSMRAWVASTMAKQGVANDNLVKPGIGEATRAVLRRAPRLVLIADLDDPDVRHLRLLCQDRGVPVEQQDGMPVKAAAIIRSLGDV